MARRLATIAFLVPDYDEGVAWFRDTLGFAVVDDVDMGGGKRWLVVAAGAAGARLVLAKAEGPAQQAAVGAAAGGRVGYFLETDDFEADHAAYQARGVRFLEPPRREPYGTVSVFADPWGGKWDLIQPAKARA